MAWRKLTAEICTGGLVTAAVAPLLGPPVVAYPLLPTQVNSLAPAGPGAVYPFPWGEPQLAQVGPAAGVLTRVWHDGGEVTLRGRASPGQRMENPGDRLRVPARSNAHIGFRPTIGSGTIPNYLVRAGSDTRDSEYWYPCNGRRGQFLIGWSAGSGTPTCSQVRMGQPFRTPVRGSKALSPTNRLKASFSDTQGHWAEVEIEALSTLGMIAGYEDGSFRPDAPVTRAEFAALVNKAFSDRAPIRPEQDFPDSIDHWARAALRQAYALGFISGYDDGLVQPQGNIRRVEAVVALASGLGLTGEDNLGEFYKDADQIPPWARRQVGAATDQGIRIQGPNPDRFYPDQRASRADVAVFLYQALQAGDQTGQIILAPATPEAAWVLVEASDSGVDVTVLGGVVAVGPERFPQERRVVSGGERYRWTRQGVAQGVGPSYGPLSGEERRVIANSPEITTFLDPNSWLPEMAPQLGLYQTYREALLKEAITSDPSPNQADPSSPPDPNSNQDALSDLAGRLIELLPGLPGLNTSQTSSPPDLSASQIDFTLLNRRSAVAGQVQIVGRVANLGGPYRSNPGQQRVLLYEVSPGGGRQLVATADFDSLTAPNTIELTYTRDWQASSSAEGEFPPSYELILSFDQRLDQDGNPSNDDSNPRNHQLMRSGSEINALFR